MKFWTKIPGFLLIAALLVVPLGIGASALPVDRVSAPSGKQHTDSAEYPAGCHMHGGKTLLQSQLPQSQLPRSPLPMPVSYQCCLTGHDAALVQIPYQTQLSVPNSQVRVQIEPVLTASAFDRLEGSTVISTDPPGTTPLRI